MVLQLYAAFAKRDIHAIIEMLSPDVEWGESAKHFEPDIIPGRQ